MATKSMNRPLCKQMHELEIKSQSLAVSHEASDFEEQEAELSYWQHVDCSGDIPPEMSGQVALQYNRMIFVFGGFWNGAAHQCVYCLDLETNVWKWVETNGDPPAPRTSHSGVVDTENGCAYILCGSGSVFGHSNLGDVYEYMFATHTWKQLHFTGAAITPRYGQSVVFHKNKLYLFGGTHGVAFSSSLYCLDLITMTCTLIEEPGGPCARYKHSANLAGNKMIIFGGASADSYTLNDMFLFELDSRTWTQVNFTSNIRGRWAHSMQIVGNQAIMFGGTDRVQVFDEIMSLDLGTYTWSSFPLKKEADRPPPRYFHSSFYDSESGNLIIFGGKAHAALQLRHNDVWKLRVADTPVQCSLGQDLLHFLELRTMTDVIIDCSDNVRLSAHAAILKARSLYLKELLNSKSVRRGSLSEDEINIAIPYQSHIVELLLVYIYSDTIPRTSSEDDSIPSENYAELMSLARQYTLFRLERLCLKRIEEALNGKSVLAILSVMRGFELPVPLLESLIQVYIRLTLQTVKQPGINESYFQADPQVRRAQLETVSKIQDMVETTNYWTYIYAVPQSYAIPKGRLGLDLLSLRASLLQEVPYDYQFHFLSSHGQVEAKLSAHLLILAARSGYFGSYTFREAMVEGKTRICEFLPSSGSPPLSPQALSFFLDYLYGGVSLIELFTDPVRFVDIENSPLTDKSVSLSPSHHPRTHSVSSTNSISLSDAVMPPLISSSAPKRFSFLSRKPALDKLSVSHNELKRPHTMLSVHIDQNAVKNHLSSLCIESPRKHRRTHSLDSESSDSCVLSTAYNSWDERHIFRWLNDCACVIDANCCKSDSSFMLTILRIGEIVLEFLRLDVCNYFVLSNNHLEVCCQQFLANISYAESHVKQVANRQIHEKCIVL